MNMKSNILEILGVAGKEDIITNLLAHAVEYSPTFRHRFLDLLCGITNHLDANEFKVMTRTQAGSAGIPDLVVAVKYEAESALVVIENKLKAEEGDDQTSRYQQPESIHSLKAKARFFPENEEVHEYLVFLTLFPESPSGEKFVNKIYRDLYPLLDDLPFNENATSDLLLRDFRDILREFYSFEKISLSDLILERLRGNAVLDGPYLYFTRLFENLALPCGLWLESTFRSSAQGRRFYGAQFYKEGWCLNSFQETDGKRTPLDPIRDRNIHFEPQFNIINQTFSIYLHYEISPYRPDKWARENIKESHYQAYRLVRTWVTKFLQNAEIQEYESGGGSNQIGKAVLPIDNSTTVEKFYEMFHAVLARTVPAIDEALSVSEAFSFSLIDLVEAINNIAAFCKSKKYHFSLSETADEYGLYFQNEGGKNILWAGIWCSRWFSSHLPLCLAVHESAGDWSQESLLKFKNMGKGKFELFENHAVRDITITSDSDNVAQYLMREIEELLFNSVNLA